MKKFIVFSILCVLTSYVTYGDTLDIADADTIGYNRFSIGVRGGAAIAIMSSGSFTSRVGYNALLDLEYSHFFNRKSENVPYCGILAGVSVGYIATGMKGSIKDQYTTADADGDRVDYTITADNVVSSIGQLQVQVPLMFTMLYKGLFVNVGPRFAIPVYSPYSQTLENAHIAAYYEPYGVTRVDNVITGKLAEEQLNTKSTWDAPVFQLFVSAEIGYEFALKNGHSIGIGLYADYCAFNTFKKDATANSMISVSQIGADPANPAPKVEVLPAISVYADKFSCFDVGLKLVYNLNFKK